MFNLRLRLCLGLMFFLAMVAPKATMAEKPAESSEVPSTPVLSFAAYGDMPYLINLPDGRTDDQVLTEEIAPALRQRQDIPFVINLGDLSRPETACSDDWLRQTKTFWERELVKPVFYTPGDNDWADCDRESLAVRQSEIERLQQVRNIFFSSPQTVTPGWQLEEIQRILAGDPGSTHPESSLGAIRRVLAITPRQFAQEWRYERQPELPENAIWWRDGVLFVTVHMTNTDNGRTEILIDNPKQAIALVDERDRQNQRWLSRAFELAQRQDTKAVVVATQLDPFGRAVQQETPLSRCLSNPAYAAFCTQVETLAGGLDKPVLLLHGDTSAYCLDQPFDKSKNLWRLNAPGDFKYIDAVVIKVFPDDLAQPFQVTGLLSETAAPTVCNYE